MPPLMLPRAAGSCWEGRSCWGVVIHARKDCVRAYARMHRYDWHKPRRHRTDSRDAKKTACAHTRACTETIGITDPTAGMQKNTACAHTRARFQRAAVQTGTKIRHQNQRLQMGRRERSASDPRAIRGRAAAGKTSGRISGRFARLRARCKFAEALGRRPLFGAEARKRAPRRGATSGHQPGF